MDREGRLVFMGLKSPRCSWQVFRLRARRIRLPRSRSRPLKGRVWGPSGRDCLLLERIPWIRVVTRYGGASAVEWAFELCGTCRLARSPSPHFPIEPRRHDRRCTGNATSVSNGKFVSTPISEPAEQFPRRPGEVRHLQSSRKTSNAKAVTQRPQRAQRNTGKRQDGFGFHHSILPLLCVLCVSVFSLASWNWDGCRHFELLRRPVVLHRRDAPAALADGGDRLCGCGRCGGG